MSAKSSEGDDRGDQPYARRDEQGEPKGIGEQVYGFHRETLCGTSIRDTPYVWVEWRRHDGE